MNEKKLLRRLRHGDESVLPELIRQYSGYAYAIASNILSHALGEEDIEEVVSDSFLCIWKNRESIETDMLKAYLAAVVRNKAKSALRKYHAEEPLEDDILQISIPNQPEQKILLSELREIAHAAVDSLGEPDSSIIMKKYYMDMDSKQIAAELAMKPSAVRMRCSRAASKLKELLEARGFMEGIL